MKTTPATSTARRSRQHERNPAPEIEGATVEVRLLKPYPGNARKGDVGALKRSLETNGQYRPIVVNRPTMEVLAGNHTLFAAQELGWRHIAVTYVDVDDEQARRIVLVDNRTSDLAGYDTAQLIELLSDLDDLDGSGYDRDALDDLLDEVAPAPLEEDEVAPRPRRPKTKPGEVITLGRHRLVCGDATAAAPYQALLDTEQAGMLWTDPPYGVAYEGRTAGRLRIKNDTADGLGRLLAEAFALVDSALTEGAPLYVAHPSGAQSATFITAFLGQGWLLRQTLIWLKQALVVGHADYHHRHEPILYGFKAGEGRLGRGGPRWYGGHSQSTVLEIDRPAHSREHPTMKPPQLIEIALANSSRRREIVIDPFAGSGSTLIACERLGRTARLIELDPGYCDVIAERFERLTGIAAERL